MALGNRNKKRSERGNGSGSGNKKGKKKDSEYRNVGSLWEATKFDGYNISINDYSGNLIYQDKDTGEYYKVKAISCYEPKRDDVPKNLVYDLVIDLKSDYQTEQLED